MGELSIRDVSEDDAEAIAGIYAHHVLHGTATYDIDPPSVEDTLAKIRRITANRWPFIVCELEGEVVGYAYATKLRDRAAYRFAAEDSIYVADGKRGRGIGKALLGALVERSAAAGFTTLTAVIGGAEPASIAVHSSLGFAEVGRLKGVGFKFDRWLDSVYMQRDLGG